MLHCGLPQCVDYPANSSSHPKQIIGKQNFKREEIFVICLKEAEIDYTKLANYNFVKESFVKIGSIFKLVKSRGIKDVCFAGRVKKPHFSSVRPDFKGFFLLFKILKSRIKGDNFILKTIIEYNKI